jgi:exonuclease SbcD
MKFFHISDLHLGKRVNEFSMLDDQRHILTEIARLAADEKPDAVLIAGDVYDKSVPGVEAVRLLDGFLVRLNESGIAVFMIAGNHDSAERVSFASTLLTKSNVHISNVYDGKASPVSLYDGHGRIDVWMLPYLKPQAVRQFFPDKEISSYSDALAAALDGMEIDASIRNVLVAHQFVTGAFTSESEELCLGGSENVDASLFDNFDYVALGHIHRPQNICRKTLRYCGSPLKYSFSEANHKKSVTVVEMGAMGDVGISEIPLAPVREMREVRGSYAEVANRANYGGSNTDDYVRIVLTDEEDEPDAVMKLRCIYPNLMRLDYDNRRTRTEYVIEGSAGSDKKTPIDLFGELYERQNGRRMSERQDEYVRGVFAKIWEDKA